MSRLIYLGLTGWRDHFDLYTPDTKSNLRLQAYSSHFPIVELDASYYAVQPIRNMKNGLMKHQIPFSLSSKLLNEVLMILREGE